MKFGKNLAHLSIPEWKAYNLDYNELKASIRDVTRTSNADLGPLRHSFSSNFNYLNLFILSKYGELTRKLRVCLEAFDFIQLNDHDSAADRLSNLTGLHYKILNEISTELRKLTKFILVQRIALKKIFKKFRKHFPDEAIAQAFISSLTRELASNPKSFLNYDLTQLTARLLSLIDTVTKELDHLNDLIHKKYVFQPASNGHLRERTSISTVASIKHRSLSSSPESRIDPGVGLSMDQIGKFDLASDLKKNFSLHTLVPKDTISRSDLSLSVDVYLSIPKLCDSSIVSTIYLTTGINDTFPSRILSYEGLNSSIIVAYTGGLRKYMYCCIPNVIAEALLEYLNSSGEARASLKSELNMYLSDSNSSRMNSAMNSLLENHYRPTLKVVSNRTRYFLYKDSTQHENEDDVRDLKSASPLDENWAVESTAPSTIDTKVYEDSYYMLFDENISTTNEIDNKILFDRTHMDSFPFNKFSIHSNDSKLHSFETSLKTTVNETVLHNDYRALSLKKIPVKIQNFLSNTSVHMFKNLSLYDYMRSCYFNVVPEDINNHYSKLLNINLLKGYENVENANKQTTLDETISQDKSRSILKRQMSCMSLKVLGMEGVSPGDERTSLLDNASWTNSRHLKDSKIPAVSPVSIDDYHNPYSARFNDLETLDDNEEDDSYFVYLTFNNELDRNMLNDMVISFIKFGHRFRRAIGSFQPLESRNRLLRPNQSHILNHKNNHPLNYDSLSEDPTFYNSHNDYQIQFVNDYDQVISILYFTLSFSALFISSINLGIVYGLLKLQDEGTEFGFLNNLSVISLLVFGYLFALIFSMAGVNLSFHRFRNTPTSHSCIIWVGFIAVLSIFLWTGAVIL